MYSVYFYLSTHLNVNAHVQLYCTVLFCVNPTKKATIMYSTMYSCRTRIIYVHPCTIVMLVNILHKYKLYTLYANIHKHVLSRTVVNTNVHIHDVCV